MFELRAHSALAGQLTSTAGAQTAGVWAQARPVRLASVTARKGAREALAARVLEAYGIALPACPRRVANGATAFVGAGPDAWLASQEDGPLGFADSLAETLLGLASVACQSGGTSVVRLGGPHVRDVLAKGVFLDLHPAAFGPGAAATTVIAHVGVSLWRLQEDYEVAVPRSYAPAFCHWLQESATEVGLNVRP